MNGKIDLSQVDILEIARRYTTLKRVSVGKNGVEYAGPCPICGGRDRFRVWPDHSSGEGRFWCRGVSAQGSGCDLRGDALALLRAVGFSWGEALEALSIDPGPDGYRAGDQGARVPDAPAAVAAPGPEWQGRARALCEWARGNLWSNPAALAYLTGRGFTLETIRAAGWGFNPSDLYDKRPDRWGLASSDYPRGLWIPAGWVIPWEIGGELWRVNIRRPDDKAEKDGIKYIGPAGWGGGRPLYGADEITAGRPVVVVEGEFKAWAIRQVAGDLCAAVATGSTGGARAARWVALLSVPPLALLAFDNDENNAGDAAASWWASVLPAARRWRPVGAKDTDEMLRRGLDVRGWVIAGLGEVQNSPILTITHQGSGAGGPSVAGQGAGGPITMPAIGAAADLGQYTQLHLNAPTEGESGPAECTELYQNGPTEAGAPALVDPYAVPPASFPALVDLPDWPGICCPAGWERLPSGMIRARFSDLEEWETCCGVVRAVALAEAEREYTAGDGGDGAGWLARWDKIRALAGWIGGEE